ncbi:J domain-containing protein [Haematococcus lacustris]|uniref:J domain-containing protein n=1 Tax=Haematococcus lacustris TaxID=44745 RepID=A0A699ZNF6_HAELA|nr:J domain-containing protein [Haematococcus lacustris]
MDDWLLRQHPAKVVSLAFSRSDGKGSLSLRQLAHNQRSMMVFGRVVLAKTHNASGGSKAARFTTTDSNLAAAWASRLGLPTVQVPSMVFFRGPGAEAEVLVVKPGQGGKELEAQINKQGLMWQVIPCWLLLATAHPIM